MNSKRWISCLLGLVMGFSFSATGFCADVAKIGVVDFQRILKESLAGKQAARQMRQTQEERSEDLKKRQQEIVRLQKMIESIELTGEKSDREQKKLELSVKLDAFKEADKHYSKQLKEINDKQAADIKKDVYGVIETLGKKGGYLLILEKNDTVYAPTTIDITGKVIEEYNAAFQRKN